MARRHWSCKTTSIDPAKKNGHAYPDFKNSIPVEDKDFVSESLSVLGEDVLRSVSNDDVYQKYRSDLEPGGLGYEFLNPKIQKMEQAFEEHQGRSDLLERIVHMLVHDAKFSEAHAERVNSHSAIQIQPDHVYDKSIYALDYEYSYTMSNPLVRMLLYFKLKHYGQALKTSDRKKMERAYLTHKLDADFKKGDPLYTDLLKRVKAAKNFGDMIMYLDQTDFDEQYSYFKHLDLHLLKWWEQLDEIILFPIVMPHTDQVVGAVSILRRTQDLDPALRSIAAERRHFWEKVLIAVCNHYLCVAMKSLDIKTTVNVQSYARDRSNPYFVVGLEGEIFYINPAAEKTFGLSSWKKVLNTPFQNLLAKNKKFDLKQIEKYFRAKKIGEKNGRRVFKTKQSQEEHFQVIVNPLKGVEDRDTIRAFVIELQSLAKQDQKEEYSFIVESSMETQLPFMRLAKGQIIDANPYVLERIKPMKNLLEGNQPLAGIEIYDDESMEYYSYAQLKDLLQKSKNKELRARIRFILKSNAIRPSPLEKNVFSAHLSLRFNHKRHQKEISIMGTSDDTEMLKKLKMDAKFEIYNPKSLLEARQQHYQMALENPEKSYLLLYLDIDNFKQINDSFGNNRVDHFYLDPFIHNFNIMVNSLNGFLGRHGGEEFVAMIPAVNGNHAMYIDDEIRTFMQTLDAHKMISRVRSREAYDDLEELEHDIEAFKRNFKGITYSAGAVFVDQGFLKEHRIHSDEELLNLAIDSQKKAKRLGKNQTYRFEQSPALQIHI